MNRIKEMIRQREFLYASFCLALVVFCWPLLVASPGMTTARAGTYYFIVWTVIIFLLFLIGKFHDYPTEDGKGDENSTGDVTNHV